MDRLDSVKGSPSLVSTKSKIDSMGQHETAEGTTKLLPGSGPLANCRSWVWNTKDNMLCIYVLKKIDLSPRHTWIWWELCLNPFVKLLLLILPKLDQRYRLVQLWANHCYHSLNAKCWIGLLMEQLLRQETHPRSCSPGSNFRALVRTEVCWTCAEPSGCWE